MKTKKFLSLVLSAAMILGVAVPVAAGQGVEAEQQPIVEKMCIRDRDERRY